MFRRKVKTDVQTELLPASPVPENKAGYCEGCKAWLKSVETRGGEKHCGCPRCGQWFVKRPGDMGIEVGSQVIGGEIPKFEVVRYRPVVVQFHSEKLHRDWSVTLPMDWSE